MLDVEEMQRAAVGPTRRLVEFLRELVRTGHPAITDVEHYEAHDGAVRWLHELRRPDVDIDINVEARPGETVFSVHPIVAEPAPEPPALVARWLEGGAIDDSSGPCPELSDAMSPDQRTTEVLQLYVTWAATWELWAAADRHVSARRRWFDTLAQIGRLIEQQDDVYELMIGTGLLSWAPSTSSGSSGSTIRHPVLTTPVDIRADLATGRIDVVVSPGATTRFGDRQLLTGQAGFDPGRAEVLREQLQIAEARPLADDNKELLTRWRELALDRARPYEHMWEPTEAATTAADLRFAPALIMRRRDRTSLIDYYDRMLLALSGPDAAAPVGLAQLLQTIEPDDRLAWLQSDGGSSGAAIGDDPLFPLAANPEQRQIVDRLTGDIGVVVQGPPGTGKTHTIANLVSALLAKGQRVLVTSQKAQALRVLRDKMPPPIQKLCVSLTDVGRGGSHELDESVTALSDRYAGFSPVAHEARVRDLAAQREAARLRVAELKEAVRGLRESETFVHPPIAPGYEGTRARLAEQLAAHAERCDWVPRPFPDEAPFDAPLTTGEVVELRRLLADETPERRARADQVLPDVSGLPTAVAVRDLVATEAAAAASAREAESELSRALSAVDADQLAALQSLVRQVAGALHQLGLDGDPDGWPDSWFGRALVDGFAGRDMSAWQTLAQVAAEARTARDALASIGLRQVTLPDVDPAGPDSLAGQLEAGWALRAHLVAGNTIKRRMRPAVQKRTSRLLDGAQVNGVPVTTIELLDVVLARMGAEHTARLLVDRWAATGVRTERPTSLEHGISLLVDLASQLDAVLHVAAWRAQAQTLLASVDVLVPLRSLHDWRAFARSLGAVQARHDAERATAALAEQVARLDRDGGIATAPPELSAMATVLAARDVDGYDDALRRLVAAFGEQQQQRRADELQERLAAAHPVLADRLAETAADDRWDDRLAAFPDAWAWGRARTIFDAQRHVGLEGRLAAQLDEAVDRVRHTTAELAAEKAWESCLARMTTHQDQALRSYQANMANRGAGYGRWADRYAKGAREAMVEARGAVPAWIMPLREVVETIPPDPNSFDVVIVDEASQASIDALFLLWLAPRVIVVGDQRQCAPSQTNWGELQPIFDRLDDYLADVPEYLRVGFTPKSDLFSLLATRFGSVVRLREHFRCMPEIVGWSSRMFYADQPLVPLRQFGADRLPPVHAVPVAGAVAEGSGSRLRNPVEARAVVDHIKACIADPAYDGKTFGVVVLQGRGQVQLIDDLLQTEIPQVEREARRLRVGAPPDFQGDERHVMFLSMVIADRRRAVVAREWQRRFNVAASRAKDQMWLFHSVSLDLLSPADLRRSLLDYMADPPSQLGVPMLADLRWESERRDPFDSVFEQRVYVALRDQGYYVTPQYEVNGRRIDLVVTGAKGRLAVECDGDDWHGTPDDLLADIDRQLELERAGWRFWRVRESELTLDPEAALAPLFALLDEHGIHPDVVHPTEADDPGDEWEPIDLPDEETPNDPDLRL